MIIRFDCASLLLALFQKAFAAQPSAAPPVSAPLRGLPWSQLNFLHTSDTHGWHAGHLQEQVIDFYNEEHADFPPRPSFGADWGDYVSFAERMREKADDEGVDLLLVDTGDRIEGNGLYDASHPKGKYTLDIFAEQNIDVICSGNHELYKSKSSENEYYETVPNFRDSYLASNLDIVDPKTGEQKPLARRFKKFTTKNQGLRILAFGFLYDFTGNANNTIVQKVEDTVKEDWFQEAIRDRDIDLFLVIGHVALRSIEFAHIFRSIREQQWDAPIQFFGGHTHIRDYAKYDKKAYALESGRYMETIGFMSISGLQVGGKSLSAIKPKDGMHADTAAAPSFSRRYIDNNLFSFYHHTGLDEGSFSTSHGRNVSLMIAEDRKKLQLDKVYGCAPRDYWTNRAPFPSKHSIFSWIQDEVFPDIVSDPARSDKPRVVLSNTGALRFDIFKGHFTVDNTYSVSPFTSGFRYIKDVPFSIAKRILVILNQEVPQLWSASESFAFKSPKPQDHSLVFKDAPYTLRASQQMSLSDDADLTPGYTTSDDAGSDGDDTIHSPIKFYRVPNCLESHIAFPPTQSDPASVDLVYVDFIESYILLALKFLGSDYAEGDTDVYMEGQTMTHVISEWVKGHWPCEDAVGVQEILWEE
ncbi:hypothetical protein MMC21_005541 [Puttea exsequens]|nr:hypothetical protein [Puttea exsequens]